MKRLTTRISLIICLFSFCALHLLAQIPTNGLVAYYPFSGNANDLSGNGNNGTVYGASLTSDRFGNPNNAYYFDGISNYIKITNNSLLNSANFTYSVWVNLQTIPNDNSGYSIIEAGSVPYGSYGNIIGVANNYTLKTGWTANSGNTDGSVVNYAADSLPHSGIWYHLVMTRSDSSVNLYVNNHLRASKSTNGLAAFYSNPLDIFIGTRAEFLHYFHGSIDDILMYNRVLNQSEIAALFEINSDSAILSNITGPQEVCMSPHSLNYSVNSIPGVTYHWSYSGTNTILNGDSNVISVQFSDSSSSGILKILVLGPDSILQQKELAITIKNCSAIPDSALVAYYPFNGNANDESGNGINGTVYGATLTTDRFGNANKAYSFDGISNYIKVTNNNLRLNNFTYSVWVKREGLPPYASGYFILGIGTIPSVKYGTSLGISNHGYSGNTGFTVTSGNTDNTLIGFTGDSLLPVGTWNHMVVTRSDSAVKMYINNQLKVTQSTGGKVPFFNDPLDMFIGTRAEYINFFLGSIDDIKVFNRALNENEINLLYNSDSQNQFLTDIIGNNNVFACPEGVQFKVNQIKDASYNWSYTGTGAIITGSGDSISINFADTATNGTLIVSINGPGINPQTKKIDLVIKPCPQWHEKGLVAYYPFNGNANDESGNENNGIVHGATLTSDGLGNSNSAYSFNGMDNYISLPSKTIAGANEYTYSLWFYANQIPSYYAYIPFSAGDQGQGYGLGLGYQPDGSFFAGSYNIGSNPRQSGVFSPIMQPGQWVHIVVTRDSAQIKEFINGAKVAYTSGADINNQPANYGPPPTAVIIGGRSNLWSDYFVNGKIDEVRIYNRALSDSEVYVLYTADAGIQQLGIVTGMNSVCQNQIDVGYKVTSLYDASYNWSYTGTGATIIGNTDTVSLNFANNATKGILRVIVTEMNLPAQTRELPINVNHCHFAPDTSHIYIYDTLKVVQNISVTDTLIIDAQLTGISSIGHNIIKAYPNPTRDRITIDNGDYLNMTGYKLKIITTLGTVVFESFINTQQFDLNLNNFGGKGTYYLQILDESSQIIVLKKIILL